MSQPLTDSRPSIDPDAIEELLRSVGRYQLEGYQSLNRADVAVKDDTSYGYSVVTEYDVESERRVFEFISRHHPQDSFLGEENGNVRKDPEHYWILDPIDGTSNFTQGVPFWGPSLAYAGPQGIERGWVFFPALDQMFSAVRGRGAFLNGTPLRTSGVTEYSNLCTVGTVSRLHRRFQLTCPAKHRILGSIIVNLCYLAMGSFAAVYFRGNLWDLAAGHLIASEAGAVLESDPPLDSVVVSELEPGKTSSISVYGTANATLPPFRQFLVPLGNPIEGK
jgi:myo-inositol-1(or 4)-monophosphatase